MSTQTEALLQAFDHLPAEEQRFFTGEILRRSLPFDSGSISDEEIGHAAGILSDFLDDDADPKKG